jgi:PPP family 3-phenylpropionic acid transporter
VSSPGAPAPNPLRCWLGFAGFYVPSFAVLGVYMQYFPGWLRSEGQLSEEDVAFVLSAQTIARTLAGTFWAQLVDRAGHARSVLVGLSLASFAAFSLFGGADSVAWAWVAAFVFGALYSPMYPIVDAAALQAAGHSGFSFGRLRMVGSLSFLVVILVVGACLDRYGQQLVFPLLLAGLALMAVASFAVAGPRHATSPVRAPWWSIVESRQVVLLLVTAAVIQGSHAPYYNLSTLHWTDHGISKTVAGAIWAEGIVAEIVLLWIAARTVDRWRPTTLLMIGAAAAVVRWSIVGLTTAPGWLFATAWLHALTFACTYLGSVRALERRVPVHQRATAQGLLGACTSGVGMAVCGLIGGFAYERWEGLAFLTMAAFALVGFGLAWRLRRNADAASRQPPSSATETPA